MFNVHSRQVINNFTFEQTSLKTGLLANLSFTWEVHYAYPVTIVWAKMTSSCLKLFYVRKLVSSAAVLMCEFGDSILKPHSI